MQVTNLSYFYETARKVRGGKFVWVKDSNGEMRGNVLLGGTILNPNKGFGHLWAAQLVEYIPSEGCKIFRSFKTVGAPIASSNKVRILADGYSDAPEVGQVLMVAPETVDGTGQCAKVASVELTEYNGTPIFETTFDTSLGLVADGSILVEADASEATQDAEVLVKNPNTFVEVDRDLMPTDGFGIENANYSISTVYNKQAWIARMQPLPTYVLAKNRSYIEGIFWI